MWCDESDRQTAAAHEGRLGYRSDEQQFEGSYRLLISGANRTLDAVSAPIVEATAALERLAQCDLTARVTGNFAGDHAAIQRAFNSAVEALASALGAVSDTAASVAERAAEELHVELDAREQAIAGLLADVGELAVLVELARIEEVCERRGAGLEARGLIDVRRVRRELYLQHEPLGRLDLALALDLQHRLGRY